MAVFVMSVDPTFMILFCTGQEAIVESKLEISPSIVYRWVMVSRSRRQEKFEAHCTRKLKTGI